MAIKLDQLHRERGGQEAFKARDSAYKTYEKAYRGIVRGSKDTFWSPKPLLIPNRDDPEDSIQMRVNWVAQVGKHFMSMFSRPPRMWNLPQTADQSSIDIADNNTAFIRSVFGRSKLKAQQPKQAWYFSVRGDAIYGVDWIKTKNEKRIVLRYYDPAWCYPSLNELDLGGLDDLLITYMMDRKQAERTFKVSLRDGKEKARVYVYWTPEERRVQVEDKESTEFYLDHKLGFVPYRWCFSIPNGHFAQADVSDVLELQDVFNEGVELALDSLRRNVHAAYWGKGIRENIVPRPDEVIALSNPEADIRAFPQSAPPEMVMQMLAHFQQYIHGSAGISPLSMEGSTGGAVSGAAVRHQVEAIEARAEVKRVEMESTFASLGEYVLRILEKKFSDDEVPYQLAGKTGVVRGDQVRGWYECEAQYGEFYGLDVVTRTRLAMEGMGRVWDGLEAIRRANTEDVDPDEMERRVGNYQIHQAEIQASAQVAAQRMMQEAQAQPQQPPGPPGAPQAPPMAFPSQPVPPTPQRFMADVGTIESMLKLLVDRLHGPVWAVGELAIVGSSSQPIVAVESEQDQVAVSALLEKAHAQVVVGTPDAAEKLRIA